MIVQRKTGSMFSRIFAFSTCVTVQSLHGDSCCEDDVSMAALSKNLSFSNHD